MLSSPSSANAEGIFIAGTTLELGMSIEKLKQNISDNYDLSFRN